MNKHIIGGKRINLRYDKHSHCILLLKSCTKRFTMFMSLKYDSSELYIILQFVGGIFSWQNIRL